jgi:hypothetical protein
MNAGRQKVLAAIETTHRAVDRCVADELWLPCLVLLYAGIDSMAWLARDPADEDVTRGDFVRWCEAYLLRPPTPHCSGVDLYGARCGILHSHAAGSRLMREGQARPLWYELPTGETLIPVHSSSALLATTVRLEPFVQSVFVGCSSFVAAADADPKLGQQVWQRADQYYDHTVPARAARSEVR